MQSAVAVLLCNNPSFPVRRLPVSWRLPDSAAAVVAEAFYPFTGFRAGAHPSAEPVHLNVPAKFPDGWEANQSVMAHLATYRVRA
jgi:hypothetical protein